MKRQSFPCILLLVIFAVTLLAAPRTQAAPATYNGETFYYTVVNDSLVPLTYPTMPVYRNNTIYVPYTLLSGYFPDIRSTYSAANQVLFMSGNGAMLKFDVRRQKTVDDDGGEYDAPALMVKGQVFVPVQFTAKFLGLGYIFLSDSNIVRVGDHRVSYPDAFLASYLEEEMAAALDNLLKTGGTTAASTTTTEAIPRNATFTFLLPGPDETVPLLSVLDAQKLTALMLLDASRIADDPVSVVTLANSVHPIGIYANADDLPEDAFLDDIASTAEEDPDISIESAVDVEALTAAVNGVNDRLYRLLREKSRLLFLDGENYPELRGYHAAEGFVPLTATHRFEPCATAEALVSAVTAALAEVEGDVSLLLPGDTVTVQAMPAIAAALRQLGFTLRSVDWTADPLT